ncbi:MAG TPA: ribbon-helix-helix protein, CopG family [Candidatus Micrarchaeia archaeon]|nr:ribbon-helix-helix protein, CopG family [Candidatus Micrarchaeia archaeon]
MERTQISLDAEDRRLLDAESRRTGRSMSALIRGAVRARYGDPPPPADHDLLVLREVWGAWAEGAADAASAGSRVRSDLRSGRRLPRRV